MRFGVVGCAAALAVAISVGCGKSEAEKQAEQAAAELEKAAAAMEKAAESGDAAKGMEAFAKAMGDMSAAMNDGKPVDPVGFRDLETVLPEMSGWTMEKPRGERMTSPVPFSQVETSYTQGEKTIDMKVVDSGFNQILIAPWAMFLASGYERETSDGFEKSVNIGGNPGFEKWENDTKRGEVNIVIAKRFLVTVEGQVDDVKVLEEFASKLDAAKLTAMK